MLTLIHAPQSRSSRFLWLLEELGADYDVRYVSIRRGDGSGAPDDANPHPHKQVPALVHGGTLVTESAAVAQYLTDLYPDSEMGRGPGDPQRGAYLSWLAYYAGVIEPAGLAAMSGITAGHPHMARLYQDMCAHVIATLTEHPFLLGDRVSAADVLLGSALGWGRRLLPESIVIDRYVETLMARPALERANEIDSRPDGFHE